MKLLLLCLCLGVIEVSALAVPTDVSDSTDGGSLDLSCEGDGRYRWRCNWCRCVGGRSLCTKRGCSPGLIELFEGGPECEGNITFKKDCNTCRCVDRKAICTTKFCGPLDSPSEISVSVAKELTLPRSTKSEPECTAGSRWRVDCNWCTCNELGQGICTKKACPDEPTEEEKGEPHCEGTSRWRQDCNWCNCVEGRGLCTLKACGEDVAPPPPSDVSVSHPSKIPKPSDDEVLCTNGSRFRDECNWCYCDETGVPSCTMIFCIPELIEASKNEPMCIGDSKWKRDCNWCNCANGKAFCTLKECFPGIDTRESQEECTNGSRWKEDCNWCRCNNGVGLCTKKLCPEGLPEQTDEPDCEGNSQWKRDYNWCNCVEGRAVCTEIGCNQGVDTRESQEVCTNGSRWKEDCNWCRCNNGVGVCTRRLCPEGLPEQTDQPECEGNSRWKRDCNWCNCVEGRAVCTEIGSNQDTDTRESQEECTNGSRWKEDCNWCRCNNAVGLCTKKLCPEGLPDQTDEPECEGTSRWKRDCNWCNCVDGRAVCTEIGCNQGVDTRESQDVCTNGSRWREDCNWCRCNNGVGVCTKRLCPEGLPEETDQPECEGNSRWKRDCNWCNCVEGRAVCTEIGCNQGSVTRELQEVCTNGSRWKEDCNWCRCNNGLGVCTRRLCPEGLPEQTDEPECEGNSRWKRDCNWCNCVDGRAVCTEIGCNQGSVSNACIEGTKWNDGCNDCECLRGTIICTERYCQDLQPQCPDGYSWKEDCNTCHCTNGVPMCTKMSCSAPRHCLLPAIRNDGPLCEGFQLKWTFDSASRQCKSIIYGGCGGTDNLFDSESDCFASCVMPVNRGISLKGSGLSGLGQQIEEDPTKSQTRCLLPVDEGPCFGALPRFFYNKVTGNCEKFTFGGCLGNVNRFSTLEECQDTCVGIAPATDEACARSQCPWKRWGHYLAKGCLPQYDGGACCPTRFLCASYYESQGNKTHCLYRNKVYDVGEKLEVADDCSASCLCIESFASESPEIVCASVECPDLFHPHPVGCRPLYRLGQCCAYDYDCADSQSPAGLETRSQTCFWNNRTYHEGDQMYFDEFPCQRCICGSEFSDPFGPGCVKIDCGYEFRYAAKYERDCVPIFFKEKCCPIDWLCPGDSRIAEDVGQDIKEEEDRRPDQCHLGPISLEVGKSLQLSNCEIDCRCITPPEFTCVMLDNCEAVREKQSYKDCSEISCDIGCTPLTDTLSGCITCSCKNESFTCPELQCPPSCGTTIDYETGCPKCSCQCPFDSTSQSPCPELCRVIRDSVTGCPVLCECIPEGFSFSSFQNCSEDFHCPENCTVHIPIGSEIGCAKCECDSNTLNGSSSRISRRQARCPPNPPCPQDCAVIRKVDQNTGCIVCTCDPQNPGNPFITRPFPPNPINPFITHPYSHRSRQKRYPSCRPQCPQDCAVRYTIDRRSGCLICTCIQDRGNPFAPIRFPNPHLTRRCSVGPNAQPPCPQDCLVIQTVDKNTGCPICICDPNDTGNPFGPLNPPPSPTRNCPVHPGGKPPCPQDCGVIQTVDKNTGCPICICDPNDTGNPFGPLNPPLPPTRSCPVYPGGNPPCPEDCGVIQTVDQNTGCPICICDPNDTGNPFGPLNPPLPPTRNCPVYPGGKPPCPQDCGVIQTVDKNTGCPICICDPNDTGNPFGPLNPPLPPTRNCPVYPGGNPPCPQDCGVIQTVDKNTGCPICICDPNDTGNPFGPFNPPPPPTRSCPVYPGGNPPCPQDCGVIQTVDEKTGCPICICDPNDTGNPFEPLNPPPPPTRRFL